MSPLDECCRRCQACERVWCCDNDVSPGEDQGICRDCFDVEDTRTEADLLNAHDSLGFVSVEWSAIAENDTELGTWWAPALGSESA